MPEPEPICIYEKREPHTAIIRLNRPEKKNSISRDLYWALDEAWHKAKDDDDVWTIILTGTADTFCAGGDLKENLAFARGEMKGPRSGPRQYGNLRALRMHKPVIAAINGYAVGGGFNLALACDIRYCVPAAKFGCSEVRWSHMAAWPNYVCQLPTGWAYWFALTGQMIDADTAFRLGLVQKICAPDKLIDDCMELCATINRNGRLIAGFAVGAGPAGLVGSGDRAPYAEASAAGIAGRCAIGGPGRTPPPPAAEPAGAARDPAGGGTVRCPGSPGQTLRAGA